MTLHLLVRYSSKPVRQEKQEHSLRCHQFSLFETDGSQKSLSRETRQLDCLAEAPS
jgi:hypothetical protein